jgi:hypothetical protein
MPLNPSDSRENQLADQLSWLQRTHPDSFVPRELVTQLLKQDMAANFEVDTERFNLNNRALARAANAGYPSYETLAAQLRGNRLAVVPLTGGVTAVFSATGKIGEQRKANQTVTPPGVMF